MDLLDKIENNKYLEMKDDELWKCFKLDNEEGIFNKDIRKGMLLEFITEYLKTNTLKSFIKILVDCVPMGYIARVIRKLRRKII